LGLKLGIIINHELLEPLARRKPIKRIIFLGLLFHISRTKMMAFL